MRNLYKDILAVLRSEHVCFCLFGPTVTLNSKRKCNSLDHFLSAAYESCDCGTGCKPVYNSPLRAAQSSRIFNSLLLFPRKV